MHVHTHWVRAEYRPDLPWLRFFDESEKLQNAFYDFGGKYDPSRVDEVVKNDEGQEVFGAFLPDGDGDTVALYKGCDEYTEAEEYRHWYKHQENLRNWETGPITQKQFDQIWKTWNRRLKKIYNDKLEQDAVDWFLSFGFTKR